MPRRNVDFRVKSQFSSSVHRLSSGDEIYFCENEQRARLLVFGERGGKSLHLCGTTATGRSVFSSQRIEVLIARVKWLVFLRTAECSLI